jgi:hypothetical protein
MSGHGSVVEHVRDADGGDRGPVSASPAQSHIPRAYALPSTP